MKVLNTMGTEWSKHNSAEVISTVPLLINPFRICKRSHLVEILLIIFKEDSNATYTWYQKWNNRTPAKMQNKTVAQKMGIKENARTIFVHPDKEAIRQMGLPSLHILTEYEGEFDYIHLFLKSQSDFNNYFPKLKAHLKPGGMMWVSWPKGGKLDTDLNLKTVIKLGYDYGLVESTCLSVSEIWSGLKFTHPKKGKVYNNSYGKLKE